MMSYVAATREVILYGGVSHDPCGDTWRLTLRVEGMPNELRSRLATTTSRRVREDASLAKC